MQGELSHRDRREFTSALCASNTAPIRPYSSMASLPHIYIKCVAHAGVSLLCGWSDIMREAEGEGGDFQDRLPKPGAEHVGLLRFGFSCGKLPSV